MLVLEAFEMTAKQEGQLRRFILLNLNANKQYTLELCASAGYLNEWNDYCLF